jgi:hypothetical protein
MRIAVVFPDPFGPRNPKMHPAGTHKSTPASARTVPYDFVNPDASMTFT